MAFAYFDRVKETSSTAGLGAITLAGAVGGFQAFSARYANGDTLHYTITHPNGSWEVGLGTWLTGGQLARTTVLASSNSNALVNFAAGTKEVFVTHPAIIESALGARFFAVADQTARDAIPAAALRLNMLCLVVATSAFYRWNGASWVAFGGFAPTGTATGQAQIWNQSLGNWQASSLDLADLDAVGSSVLGPSNGGTGIAGAGGTADRVLLTTNGTSWGAGLVNLATMVTGALALTGLAAAVGFSVLGRSATGSGDRADIAAAQIGQVLRRDGSGLSFGALDLADPDAVTGLLPGTNVNPSFGSQNILTSGTLSAGKTALTPAIETSGSPFALRVTGAAHTTLAASTEVVDLDFNLARTVQRATGAVSVQRAARFTAPTYSFVGASVISDAATLAISGAPAAGTNATITRSYALWVQAGSVRFQGLGAGVVQTDTNGVLSSSALASTSIAPGTDGQVFITTGGNAGWGNDLGAGSLTTTGYFGGKDTAVAAATGGVGLFRAGDATAATGGIGGAVTIRAGDATGGSGTRTGGALTIRSGTGASGSGTFQALAGALNVINYGLGAPTTLTVGDALIPEVWYRTTAGGIHRFRVGSNALVSIGATAFEINTPTVFQFDPLVANPSFKQGDNTNASATGYTLTVSAQNATNVTSTGGVLELRSGTGTTIAGNLNLRTGSALKLQITPSLITLSNPTLRFDWTQVSPTITQETSSDVGVTATPFLIAAQDITGNSSRGAKLTLRAGNASGSTGTRTGGALELASGTGFDVASASAPGDVTISRGASAVFSASSTSTFLDHPSTITLRINGATNLIVGSSALTLHVRDYLWNDTVVTPRLMQQTTSTATGQLLTVAAQDTTNTTTAVAGAFLLRAGDATGGSGTRTGGALTVRSGTGATNAGALTLQRGTTNVFAATDGGSGSTAINIGTTNGAVTLRAGGAIDYYVYMTYDQGTTRHAWDGISFYQGASVVPGNVTLTKHADTFFTFGHNGSNAKQISFFGAAASTQAADPGLLTGAFGTTSSAIADVTASHSQTILNNNFRALQDTINRMRTIIRGFGLAA